VSATAFDADLVLLPNKKAAKLAVILGVAIPLVLFRVAGEN
jgi:hypothetical protein